MTGLFRGARRGSRSSGRGRGSVNTASIQDKSLLWQRGGFGLVVYVHCTTMHMMVPATECELRSA